MDAEVAVDPGEEDLDAALVETEKEEEETATEVGEVGTVEEVVAATVEEVVLGGRPQDGPAGRTAVVLEKAEGMGLEKEVEVGEGRTVEEEEVAARYPADLVDTTATEAEAMESGMAGVVVV